VEGERWRRDNEPGIRDIDAGLYFFERRGKK